MFTNARTGISTLMLTIMTGIALQHVEAGQQATSQGPEPAAQDAAKVAGPELARLEMFVGRWKVTETHLDAEGRIVATVKGTEKTEWILDHHAIRREYTTAAGVTAFRAIGLLTWNTAERAYEGVWFDNRSTRGPVTVRGKWQDENGTIEFTLQSTAPDGSPLRYKVVERFTEDKTRLATTFLVDGAEFVKRLEVKYERAAACPSRLRVVDEVHRRPRKEREDN
jgi:hypothetical protein